MAKRNHVTRDQQDPANDKALASAQHWKRDHPDAGNEGFGDQMPMDRDVGQFQDEGQPPLMKK